MEAFPFLDALFAWLWKASWQASILVLLVLAVQWLFHKRLSPQWRHALWLLVLVRLMLPASPESNLSVFNLAATFRDASIPVASIPDAEPVPEIAEALQTYSAFETAAVGGDDRFQASEKAASIQPPVPSSGSGSWQTILAGVWLLGVLLVGLRITFVNLRFAGRLRRNARPPADPAVLPLFEECHREAAVRTELSVRETSLIVSPALFGFLRPTLLLPQGMSVRFSPGELRHIFLHELAHVRRGDVITEWIMIALQTLHWFNPLLWFTFRRMRADRELACDAAALSIGKDEKSKHYGQTIIKVLEQYHQPQPLAGLVGILENKNDMKQRIQTIAAFGKTPRGNVLTLALMIGLAAVALTDATNDEQTTFTNPDQTVASRDSEGEYLSVELIPPDLQIAIVKEPGTPNTYTRHVEQDGIRMEIAIDESPLIDGGDVQAIRHGKDDIGRPTLSLVLTDDSARRVAQATRRMIGGHLSVSIDIQTLTQPLFQHTLLVPVDREIERGLLELTSLLPEQVDDLIIVMKSRPQTTLRGVFNTVQRISETSKIYAADNAGRLPGNRPVNRELETINSIHEVAGLLATEADLNDASVWIFQTDSAAHEVQNELTTVLDDRRESLHSSFAARKTIAFDYATGLHMGLDWNTPLFWTRGLREDGTWDDQGAIGSKGGYVVNLGGSLYFFHELGTDGGRLRRFSDGAPTANILEALPPEAKVVGSGPATLHGATGAPVE